MITKFVIFEMTDREAKMRIVRNIESIFDHFFPHAKISTLDFLNGITRNSVYNLSSWYMLASRKEKCTLRENSSYRVKYNFFAIYVFHGLCMKLG